MAAKNEKEQKAEWSQQVHLAIHHALGDIKGGKSTVKKAGAKRVEFYVYVKSDSGETRETIQKKVAAKLEESNLGVNQVDYAWDHAASSFPAIRIDLVDKSWMYIIFKNEKSAKIPTSVAESSQALFAARAFQKGSPLDKCDQCSKHWAEAYADCDIPQLSKAKALDMCANLNEEWVTSNTLGANALLADNSLKGANWKFHRGSKTVEEIYKCFSKVKSIEKQNRQDLNINPNKWSPADIYLIDKSWTKEDVKGELKNISTIDSLNAKMQEWITDKKVIGVSLKKMKSNPTIKDMNFVGKEYQLDVEYTGISAPPTSTSGYIEIKVTTNGSGGTKKKKINFRNFTDQGGFSGEVLEPGGSARHGKISHGPIDEVLTMLGYKSLPANNVARSECFQKGQWMAKKNVELGFMPQSDAKAYASMVPGSTINFASSKYLVLSLFDSIGEDLKKPSKMNTLAEVMYRYAGSQIKGVSAPYLKLM